MLERFLDNDKFEAGCDEAGRGCLAGPVTAAAVILPADFESSELNDSKKMSAKNREAVRKIIEEKSLSYAVAFIDNVIIDEINILKASILAMHKALEQLKIRPDQILVDGNRFFKFKDIKHLCVVKGDGKYLSIAAASVLAKTYRDEYMEKLHQECPEYGWENNKGYPTKQHRKALSDCGLTKYHRRSFQLINPQMELFFK